MHQRILQAIAKATSQQPDRLDHLAKRLGIPESQAASLIEELYVQRAVNQARITRKGESFLAIWPTSLPAPSTGYAFTINPKKRPPSGSFTRPPRPERGNTVSNEAPKKQKEPTEMMAQLLSVMDLATLEIPMTPGDISELLGKSQAAWTKAMDLLLERNVVAITDNPNRKGSRAFYLVSPTSPSGAAGSPADQAQVSGNNSVSDGTGANLSLVAAAVSTPSPGPAVAAAAPGADTSSDQEVSFAIHDDGRLSITDDDQVIVLPPSATRRLGYFLGCLEVNAWPPRFDPQVLEETKA